MTGAQCPSSIPGSELPLYPKEVPLWCLKMLPSQTRAPPTYRREGRGVSPAAVSGCWTEAAGCTRVPPAPLLLDLQDMSHAALRYQESSHDTGPIFTPLEEHTGHSHLKGNTTGSVAPAGSQDAPQRHSYMVAWGTLLPPALSPLTTDARF